MEAGSKIIYSTYVDYETDFLCVYVWKESVLKVLCEVTDVGYWKENPSCEPVC